MTMYSFTQQKLKVSGELMIMTADGTEFELHLHNTEFSDDISLITLETGNKTIWIDGEQIVYAWIHRVQN